MCWALRAQHSALRTSHFERGAEHGVLRAGICARGGKSAPRQMRDPRKPLITKLNPNKREIMTNTLAKSQIDRAIANMKQQLLAAHMLLVRTTFDRLANGTLSRDEAESRVTNMLKDAHHA